MGNCQYRYIKKRKRHNIQNLIKAREAWRMRKLQQDNSEGDSPLLRRQLLKGKKQEVDLTTGDIQINQNGGLPGTSQEEQLFETPEETHIPAKDFKVQILGDLDRRTLRTKPSPCYVHKKPYQKQRVNDDDDANFPPETRKYTVELEIDEDNAPSMPEPYLEPRKTKTNKITKLLKPRKIMQRKAKVKAQQASAAAGRPAKGPITPTTPNERAMVMNVYKYLKTEYDLLKKVNQNTICDLNLFSDVLKRTADACGVTRDVVTHLLEEEERREQHRKRYKEYKERLKIKKMQQEMELKRKQWQCGSDEADDSYEIVIEERPDAESLKVEIVDETTKLGVGTEHNDVIDDESEDNNANNDEMVQNSEDDNVDDGSITILQPLQIKLEPADIEDPLAENTASLKAEPFEMDCGDGIAAKRQRTGGNRSPQQAMPVTIAPRPRDPLDPSAEDPLVSLENEGNAAALRLQSLMSTCFNKPFS